MDYMIEKLFGLVLVVTRLSAFFLIAPIFSSKTVPVRVRLGTVIMLSLFFAGMTEPFDASEISNLMAVLLLANEALYGFAVGLIVILIFSAVKVCGRIIEQQMGFSMAETMNPMTNERDQPFAIFLELIFILLFLSADGHHFLIMIISQSFEAFPAGQLPSLEGIFQQVTEAGSLLLTLALRLAGPILTAFLLLLAVLAVCARMLPDMNILFISMPFRVGMGIVMTAFFIPFLNGFVKEFSQWVSRLLPI